MKALDLYCGLGGWSDGLALEGFEVLGVEIEPHIAEQYKHPVIVADVRDLDPRNFMGYDLIVGSPPCREFTQVLKAFSHRWKKPPNLAEGLELVHAFLSFVEVAKPTYWLMENVPGLAKHLDIKPRTKTRLGPMMFRYFWGNYPLFLIPLDVNKRAWVDGKDRKWHRARIPLCVSQALGRAIRSSLRSASR